MQYQQMSCPNCGGQILFNLQQMYMGVKFSCASCKASIGIAPQSIPIVKETAQEFDKMKSELLSKKEKPPIGK
jgi:predicted RNA-binding Zn-ribbon protein involved in translation (DUF1610 family)